MEREHAEEDLLDLLAHVGIEVVRAQGPLLDEDLAQARRRRLVLQRRIELGLRDHAEAIQDRAEAIFGHVAGSAAHVAAAKEDGLAHHAVDDGELPRPLIGVDEVDDVDQAADGIDLARDGHTTGRDGAHRRARGAAIGHALQDDDLAGGGHDAEATRPSAKATLRLRVESDASLRVDRNDVTLFGHRLPF
jgi:hypothetical protein